MYKNCKTCTKEFKFFPSQKAGLFCSRRCHTDYRITTIIKSGKGTKSTALSYLKRFKDYNCSECGIKEYNNKPIQLQIEHVDGNPKNNIIENITWLCPNCHSQTKTWGSKNAGKKAKANMLKGLKTGWSKRGSGKAKLSIKELEKL